MKLAFANRHNLSEAVHRGDEDGVVLVIDLASDVAGWVGSNGQSFARSILLSEN